jgi:hypothetical protein
VSTALLRLGGGALGEMMRLISFAACYAVKTGGEQITIPLLEKASVEPPLEAVQMLKAQEEAKLKQAA